MRRFVLARNVPVAAAVFAAALVLYATRAGSFLTPDSVTYSSMAHNIARGRGVVDFSGTPTKIFPPGYPLLLALGLRMRVHIDAIARSINALSAFLCVLLSWRIIVRCVRTTRFRFGALAMVATSAGLLDIYRHSWSEAPCAVLSLSSLLAFDAALRATLSLSGSGSNTSKGLKTWVHARWFALGGLLAGAAVMVRYAAVGVVATELCVFLMLILMRRDGVERARAAHIAAFVVSAALFPVIWLVRNATTGTNGMLGQRVGDTAGFVRLVNRFGGAIQQVFVAHWAFETWSTVAVFVGYGVTMLLALFVIVL